MLENNKVVYVYRDVFNVPFYVGMGYMKRAYETMHRTPEFKNKYNEYERVLNKPCYPDIVCTHLSQDGAFELEHFIISEIGLENLTNISRGNWRKYTDMNMYTVRGERRTRKKKRVRVCTRKKKIAHVRKEKPHPYRDKIIYK